MEPNNTLEKPIRAILFDLDGVCFLKPADEVLIFTLLAEKTGASEEAIEQVLSFEKNGMDIGTRTLKQQIDMHADDINWTEGADALLTFWRQNERGFDTETFTPELADVLRKSALSIHAATNQAWERFKWLKKAPGFQEFFSASTQHFCSAELGVAKPNTLFFHKALRILNLPAASVLFVDDREENVATASSAHVGMHTCLYTQPSDLYETFDALDIPYPKKQGRASKKAGTLQTTHA